MSRLPEGRPEIFYSVQGEGLNQGRPAVFLRLALCNLSCTWCDTKYTWDWQKYIRKEQIEEIPAEEAGQQILSYKCHCLIVTGGEPLLQQKQLAILLNYLKSEDHYHYIEVETNGTIIPDPELISYIDHWSVSPKLRNSGNPQNLREIPEAYQYFTGLPNSHFKYTLQEERDFREVWGIMKKYGILPQQVFIMPQARDRESLLEKSLWLAELCKEYGCLFSNRLQVLLWGDKRAV